MTDPQPGASPHRSFGRQYGPLIGIVVVIAVVAAVVIVAGRRSDNSTASSTGGSGGTAAPGGGTGAISFSEAKAGNLNVTFGPGCDQERGRIAIPSAFAAECYAQQPSGGATSTGVTADSIKVVLYEPADDPLIKQILAAIGFTDTAEQARQTMKGYFEIYQKYYETYGRKVELVEFQGSGASADEVAARADATKIAEEIKPFAVLGGPFLTSAFSDELAARGIVDINLFSAKTSDYLNERAPNLWTVLQSADQLAVHVSEYASKRLANRPAAWAGDENLKTQNRKFGLIYLDLPGSDTGAVGEIFQEQFRQRGVDFTLVQGSNDPTATQAQQIAKMKEAGVTSIVMVTDPLTPGNLTREATRQDYHPEWIVAGSVLTDTTVFARTYDQDQWKHAFGVSALFARGKPEANWAYKLYNWYFGHDPEAFNGAQVIFPLPTFLFTGIQAAGPNLTPQTFEQGLFAAQPTGGGPTVPQVSFGNRGYWPAADHSGIDDTVEVWWDPTQQGPDERADSSKPGMYRYADNGRRYLPGQWPTGDPKVFDPATSVAIFDTIPPQDAPPDYPRPQR